MIQGEVSHYRILGRIGSGGMGVVYRAVDTRLNRPVAIKAMLESLQADPRAVARLRREALAAASIDHPFICKVYELLEHEGQTLVVLEYVEGESLESLLRKGRPPIRRTLHFAAEVAEALGEIHRKGLVHRDVKPANIQVTPQGHAKLMDFGIVAAEALEDGATRLTVPDGSPGTPSYMSPEQALGEPATPASDVFSLGVVLYRCLTGEFPFQAAAEGKSSLRALLDAPPRPPRDLAPEIPATVEALVLRCLEKESSARYDSGAELCEALREVASTAAAPPPSGRWKAGVALSLSLALAGLVSWAVWSSFSETGVSTSVALEAPLVTWPSQEEGGRISPDGNWFSFISNRGGGRRVWVVPASGGEARPITADSEPSAESHLWSPDSRRMAVLFRAGGRRIVKILPALGGPPESVVPLDERRRFDIDLIRWRGDLIYLRMNRQLWSLDLERQTSRLINATPMKWIDVSADGAEILFSPASDERTVWRSGTDGSGAVRLSPPDFPQFGARWAGAGGMFFLSNRTSQIDLWKARISEPARTAQRIASSVEDIDDVSSDGGSVLLTQVHENSDLACLDLESGRVRQLTAQATSDFWPSVSKSLGLLVFQRSKAALETGSRLFDAQLVAAGVESCGATGERVLIDDGYSPWISPDGNRLAFLRNPMVGELWTEDLVDGSRRRVAERLQLVPFRLYPWDRRPAEVAWSRDGSELFHVGIGAEKRSEIRAVSADGQAGRVLHRLEAGWSVVDLTVAPDGRGLIWTAGKFSEKRWRVSLLPLESSSTPDTLFEDLGGDELIHRGWLDDRRRTMLLLRCFDNLDHTEQKVEVLLVAPGGETRTAGFIQRAFGNTARLDAGRRALYLTGIEGVAHNVFRFSLRDGSVLRLTQNEVQGRTFTGLEIVGGRLYYTQQQRDSEVRSIRLR